MSAMPRSYFSEYTFRILEAMLDDTTHHGQAFLRLLRNKLSNGSVVFQDDHIDPQIATINSRIDFSVGADLRENRVLVRNGGVEVVGLHLPITTLRGLALLGLTAGETIEVTRSDGAIEVLCLTKVCYQPEAHRRARALQNGSPFEPARPTASLSAASSRPGEEDWDPGPRAA